MSNTKNKNLNRFLSILLVFCMIFSMIPNIFAADVDKTFNITLTWDHTNNTSEERPDSIALIIKSDSSETTNSPTTVKSFTISKSDDLNLDSNPNTWEFSVSASVSSFDKYFYIQEKDINTPTLGFYNCSGSITTSENTINLNAECKYTTYYHQIEITQEWIDNNDSYERPSSTPIKILGKLSRWDSDSIAKELNNITINESEVVKTDTNTWVYTTATIQTRYPYLDIADFQLGNNYSTYVYSMTPEDEISTDKTNKTTIKIKHKHDLAYDLNFIVNWDDFSNYFNVRPESITVNIYGSNNANDTTNGEFIGTAVLNTANEYKVDPDYFYPSQNYRYFYCTTSLSDYDKSHGEYDHPAKLIEITNNKISSGITHQNMSLSLPQPATVTVNFNPDMLKAPEYSEIKKAFVDIYNTSNYKKSLIKTIELTPDTNGNWTKIENISIPNTTITTEFRFEDESIKELYTTPQLSMSKTLKNNKLPDTFTIDISTEYIEQDKDISFNITKTWDDFNNKYNDRPEEITVNIYGSYKENQGKELLKTQVISQTDDLNKDSNPNTWEYIISGIENNYNYYYAEEIIDNSTILGSYELTSNTMEKVITSEPMPTNNNEAAISTPQEPDPYAVSPMIWVEEEFMFKKVWDDANDIDGLRPDSIIVTVYYNDEDNKETSSVYFKAQIFENKLIFLENENLGQSGELGSGGDYVVGEEYPISNWTFYANPWLSLEDSYVWVEEEPIDEYTYSSNFTVSGSFGEYTSIRLTNKHAINVSYNVNLTNTYTAPPREVQFDIVKTWVDNDDDLSLRPTSIELEIYGTNVEGATEGGVLLDTITLNSSNKVDTNTWRKTSGVIETTYEYFYVKEKDVNGYAATISPVASPAAISDVFDPNNREEISTFANWGPDAFSYNFYKYWEDNDNAAGKRPEYVTINILYKTGSWSENPADYDTYLKFNLYEDKVVVLEDALNRVGLGEHPASNWDVSFSLEYDDRNFMFLVTEESVKNYTSEILEYPMSEFNHIQYGCDIYNTYSPEPETYSVNVTNTIVPPERDVQFQIKKIWEDEFNKYKARGPVTVNIFGTDTYGATTDGEQIGSFVITEADATTSRVWEKTSPVFSTSYKYFYIEEQLPEGSRYITRIEPLEKVEPEVEIPEEYVMERPSTYVGYMPTEEFGVNIYKTWDDNDNAAGKRPEFIDFKIYYSESDVSVDEMSLYAKVRVYEDNVEILENPLNRLEPENIIVYEWNAFLQSNTYADKDWFYHVEEVPVLSYATAINQELYNEGPAYGWETYVTNVYCPETYKTTIINIYDKPRTVQFEIVKTWNDNNDKYHLRPTFIDVEIYGVETEGATTGGELIDTVRLTYNNKIDSNTWKKRIAELETDYEYFYVKEINGSSSYTTSISPVTETEAVYDIPESTNAVSSNEDPYGISPAVMVGFEYGFTVRVHKLDENGNYLPGAELKTIDSDINYGWYGSSWTSTNTYFETYVGLVFYGGIGSESGMDHDLWYIHELEAPEGYRIADPVLIKTSDIPFFADYTFSQGGATEDMNKMFAFQQAIEDGLVPADGEYIYDAYMINEPIQDAYRVDITNTVIPPEKDVQFKVNKIWNDYLNKYNSRGPVTINIYGTNTEGATTGGSLVGSFTMTEEDFVERNIWSKTSPVFSTAYEYFYLEEVFNGENYTATISPLTKLDPPDPEEFYSMEEKEPISLYAGMIQSYSIYIQKNWEDNDNAAGKRPEFVDINIYHYESEESYENKDLYCSLRLYEEDYEILDNPSGTITSGYGGEWSATLYAPFSDSESDYWVEEVVSPNYVPLEMYIPGIDRYDRTSWVDVTNIYYVETYEATITNTYAPPTEVIFNITKTWDDNNNAANLRPLGIQVKIYGTNTEGATTGGTLIDTVILTNEDVSSTNANVWNKTVVLDADYDYFYVVELSSLGTELSTYILTNNTVTEVNNTVQLSNEDDNYISLFSGLTNKDFSITKIWNDNDNALGLRPEEIILSVYYNDTDNESGKKLLCKAKLTATTFEIIEKDDSYIEDDINVRYEDDWCFSMRLNKSCPYYIWVEEENTSCYDMSYDTFYGLVDNLDVTVTNTLKELRTYNINLTNKLDSLPIKVTKIWRDDNNRYDTRPDSLDITVYQNGTVFEVITFTSANMIGGNINVWESTINVPKFDENGNEYIYTISEDETNLELGYYYYEPSINQSSLIATNVGVWLPPLDIDVTPEYSIIVGKEIVDENDKIATAEDFWKLKLNIDDTYEFPIVLKELEKVLSKGNTSMEEEYEGYTGNVIHGVLTNKGQLLFANIKPGKYEISEIINQYFDFVGMEKIESTEGASLIYEDGKYYITLSGVTKDSESITIKVINRLEDERPFNDVGIKNNLFVIPERENIDHDQPQD